MPRFAHRRLIVFIVLLCQVVTAAVGHVPMAYAETPAQATAAPPCHEHGHDMAMEGSSGTSRAGTYASVPAHDDGKFGGHFGSCKSGLCHCACAHPPAASTTLAFGPTFTPHPPLPGAHQAPAAPKRPTVLFRPPD